MWVVYLFIIYSILSHVISTFSIRRFPIIHNLNEASYTLFEFLIFVLLFNKLFKSTRSQNLLKITAILFSIFWISYKVTFQKQDFDSIPIAIESLLILIFSLIYLFEQIKTPDSLFIYTKPAFWIVTGLLIYTAGTFFIFIYAQTRMQDDFFVRQYVTINTVFYFSRNVMFSIAMLLKPSKKAEINIYEEHWN